MVRVRCEASAATRCCLIALMENHRMSKSSDELARIRFKLEDIRGNIDGASKAAFLISLIQIVLLGLILWRLW